MAVMQEENMCKQIIENFDMKGIAADLIKLQENIGDVTDIFEGYQAKLFNLYSQNIPVEREMKAKAEAAK